MKMKSLRKRLYCVTCLCALITLSVLLGETNRIQNSSDVDSDFNERAKLLDAIGGAHGDSNKEFDWTVGTKVSKEKQRMTEGGEDSTLAIDDSIAEDLSEKIRLACFVTTREVNMDTKMKAVQDTWGKRCDKMFYVMTSNLTRPDILAVSIADRHDTLTEKITTAFTHMRRNYLDDFDWFLKADDDTYVIVENLKYLLSHFDPNVAVVVGDHFKSFAPTGYMGGGAGYVLSRDALRRLVDDGYDVPGRCRHEGGSEDIETGRCLDKIGVSKFISLDKFNKSTFHASKPEAFVYTSSFVKGFRVNKHEQGLDCCSQLAISFHYLRPEEMMNLELLLYRVSVYGRSLQYNKLDNMFAVRRATVPLNMRRMAYPGETIGDYTGTNLTEWRKRNMTIYVRRKKRKRKRIHSLKIDQ